MDNYVFELKRKSPDDINKLHESDYQRHTYAKSVGSVVEKHKLADEYYVVNNKGIKVEVSSLTEQDIFYIVKNSLVRMRENGDNVSIKNAMELMNIVDYSPSAVGLAHINDLFNNEDPKIASWAQDVLGSRANAGIEKAKAIAEYTGEDIQTVLNNLALREKQSQIQNEM